MDTMSLINRAHMGDKTARENILMENTGLIWSVVKRFMNRGYSGEELFQTGCIGMLKAIDRFDLDYNVAFSTYAVPLIAGEIKRFIRDDGIIKISRRIKENQFKIMTEREKYIKEKKKEPTVEELVRLCGLTKEEVVTAMEASREVESTDREIGDDGSHGRTVMDVIEDKRDGMDVVLNRIAIRQMLTHLDKEERKIIVLRYFQNKTQREIAKMMDTSQVQISRKEKKILNQMRKQIG